MYHGHLFGGMCGCCDTEGSGDPIPHAGATMPAGTPTAVPLIGVLDPLGGESSLPAAHTGAMVAPASGVDREGNIPSTGASS